MDIKNPAQFKHISLAPSQAFRRAIMAVGADQPSCDFFGADVTWEGENSVLHLSSGNTILTQEMLAYDLIVSDNATATSLEVRGDAALLNAAAQPYNRRAGYEPRFYVQRRGLGILAVNFTTGAGLQLDGSSNPVTNNVDPATMPQWHVEVRVGSPFANAWTFSEMAARVLLPALNAFDPATLDLTAQTGGVGETIGATGGDLLFNLNTFPAGLQKRNGAQQLVVNVWKTGADPDPTSSLANYNAPVSHSCSMSAFDKLTDDNAVAANPGCMNIAGASNQLNWGLVWDPIVCDQFLREFHFVGRVRNGTYVATATYANGEAAPQSITLPLGSVANVFVDAWFQFQFRSIERTTVTFKIERTVIGPSAVGTISIQSSYLKVPVPAPRPRGMRLTRRRN